MSARPRCTLYRNAPSLEPGVLLLIPNTFDELIAQSSQKLGLRAKVVYTENGGVIDSIDWVQNNDVLFISEGEPFWRHPRRARAAPIAAEDSAALPAPALRRCTIFPNPPGECEGVQITVPSSLDELVRTASERLGFSKTYRVLYSERGALISSVDTVQNNDMLYLSEERGFWKRSSTTVTLVTQRHDDAADDARPRALLTMKTLSHVSTLAPAVLENNRDDWIALNVGGHVFQTSRTTLCRDPSSMLARLFSLTPCADGAGPFQWQTAVDANGAYLFDRDPRYFAPLLNYLRTNHLIMDEGLDLRGILEEAMFFQITHLQQLVEARIAEAAAQAQNPFRMHYVVLTVKNGGVKLVEGPVERTMTTLNGGKTPPRKPPFSIESEIHSRVYGLSELGWLLKNFTLPEVLDALLVDDWMLVATAGGVASSASAGPKAGTKGSRASLAVDDEIEQLFIFVHKTAMSYHTAFFSRGVGDPATQL